MALRAQRQPVQRSVFDWLFAALVLVSGALAWWRLRPLMDGYEQVILWLCMPALIALGWFWRALAWLMPAVALGVAGNSGGMERKRSGGWHGRGVGIDSRNNGVHMKKACLYMAAAWLAGMLLPGANGGLAGCRCKHKRAYQCQSRAPGAAMPCGQIRPCKAWAGARGWLESGTIAATAGQPDAGLSARWGRYGLAGCMTALARPLTSTVRLLLV